MWEESEGARSAASNGYILCVHRHALHPFSKGRHALTIIPSIHVG